MNTKQEERKKLRDSLPKRYTKIAQAMLKAQKRPYSSSTILAVASGQRDNVVIERVLAQIAFNFSQEKETIKRLSKKIS